MDNSKDYWEHRFIELFNKDNKDQSTVHFEYKSENIGSSTKVNTDIINFLTQVKLTITTFNPTKGTSFRLLEIVANTEDETIEKAFQELVSMYKQEAYSTYTLIWGKTGEDHTHQSYFYAKNEYEVLNRFYAENDVTKVMFYSLKINPLS